MVPIFALWNGPMSSWGFVDIAVTVVIVAAVIGLVYIALDYFEVKPPPWAVKAFWIVIVAFVIIFAIRLVAGM